MLELDLKIANIFSKFKPFILFAITLNLLGSYDESYDITPIKLMKLFLLRFMKNKKIHSLYVEYRFLDLPLGKNLNMLCTYVGLFIFSNRIWNFVSTAQILLQLFDLALLTKKKHFRKI
jgi:hypothetical protein